MKYRQRLINCAAHTYSTALWQIANEPERPPERKAIHMATWAGRGASARMVFEVFKPGRKSYRYHVRPNSPSAARIERIKAVAA